MGMDRIRVGLIWLTLGASGFVAYVPHPRPLSHGERVESRGGRFIGFSEFSGFTRTLGENGEVLLMSPEIDPGLNWDELVVSWNADTPPGSYLRVEARVVYPDRTTKFYVMGLWSPDPVVHPRESVVKQKDDDGNVLTDTLVMKRAGGKVQVRVTLGNGAMGERGNGPPISPFPCNSPTSGAPRLRFLGLSFVDDKAIKNPLAAEKAAWGKTLDVPERCQLSYKGGEGWCSPASTSMVLAYWARELKRPELDRDVPDVAKEVFDKNWPGTGNWPFNTAYAGSFPGMRAYVTRLTDVSELEQWVAARVPVVLSLSYRLLHEKGKSEGHIVVVVGFTPEGEPIVNDPWERLEKGDRVRQVCKRENLVKAWAISKNTVYLIYPEKSVVPEDRFEHWAGGR